MTYDEATSVIFKHAGVPTPSGGYTGLLARLRPFVGLDDGDFLELLEALASIAPRLQSEETLDRTLIAALWDICRTTRFWAKSTVHSGSVGQYLPSNVRRRLDVWVDEMERIIIELLNGEEPWWAFLNTAWLTVRNKYGERAGFLVPAWSDGLTALLADEGDDPASSSPQASDMRVLCDALGQTGVNGRPASGILEQVVTTTRFLPVKRAASRALKSIRSASSN